MAITCPQCYELLDDNSIFCEFCGSELNAQNQENRDLRQLKQELKIDVATSFNMLDQTGIETEVVLEEEPSNPINTPTGDCTHFSLQFNIGSAAFIAGTTGSFQFKIIPEDELALKAKNITTILKYQNNIISTFNQKALLSMRTRVVGIAYSPAEDCSYIEVPVDIEFSYILQNKLYTYSQQIFMDVYPKNENPKKVFENLQNLTIKIQQEGAKQAGTQGKQNVNLFDTITTPNSPIKEMISQIKQSECWQNLYLYLENVEDITPLKISNPPTNATAKFTIKKLNDTKIHIFCQDQVILGRSREIDICTRNMNAIGERAWAKSKLIDLNKFISRKHCSILVEEKLITILDTDSACGTYLDGTKIEEFGISIYPEEKHILSLADPNVAPKNFPLNLITCKENYPITMHNKIGNTTTASIGSVLLTRNDQINEIYLVLRSCCRLADLFPDYIDRAWFICNYHNRPAITDGREWLWLVPNKQIPPESGLKID